MNKPHAGGLGSTFGGNPLAVRAALAVLEILIDDGLLRRAEKLGETLLSRFEALQAKHRIIGEIRGKGPMLAMELVRDRQSKEPATEETKKLTQLCYQKGLVLISCGNFGNVLRVLMPLVITDQQLEKGLNILEEALREISVQRLAADAKPAA
jgi:4-aminobutyrate aminotransferase/(S)-3-amino-2-methylpropionate transaminase